MKHATQQQTTAPQQEKAHGTKHKSPQEILEFQSKMRIDQSTHQEALTAGAFFSSSSTAAVAAEWREKRKILLLLLLSLQVTFIYLFF